MRKNKNQERKMKIRKKMKGNQEENRKDKKMKIRRTNPGEK